MDFAYYAGIYGGGLLEADDFTRLSLRAGRYVAGLLRPGAEGDGDAVRCAACAVAEELWREERRQARAGLRGETVGRYAVTYGEDTGGAAALYRAAARWLEPAGLLYRGI